MRKPGRRLFFGTFVALFSAVAIACTDFSHPPEALGRIQVLVVDSATNVGVPNLPMTLYLEDKTTAWRALFTSGDGSGEFGTKDGGVIPGKFTVFLDLTGKSYQLAAGEENFKPVRSIIGQTVTVNFKLHKVVLGGPPGG
jgi:hypothetical protein